MRLLPALLCLFLAVPLLAREPDSNVRGDYCPELLLEEKMVQGQPITWESLAGKVVLFLFYQRECEGCERQAMPRIQKLHEKYAGSHCWLVFVINTAFDKDAYPYLADVDETRKHLKRMDWTMPVARDLDERSNELFTLDDQSGTPQAVVLDEHGVVRAHDWYSEEAEMNRVDAVFENLAAGMNCKCVRMPREVGRNCQGARDAFKEGRYQDAYTAAQDICDGTGYGKEDKADAEYLKKYIDEVATNRIERIKRQYERDPEDALRRADGVIQDFDGVRGVNDFTVTVGQWRNSDHLANFRAGRRDLAKVEVDLRRPGLSTQRKQQLIGRLGAISKRTGGTVVGEGARRQIEKLSGGAVRRDSGARIGSSGGGSIGSGRRTDTPRNTSKAKPAAGGEGGSGLATNRNRKIRAAR